MVILSAFGPAFHLEDSHALLAQQSYDRIDQRKNNRVARGLGECEVKIEVSFDECFGIPLGGVHDGHLLAHGRQILFIGPGRCQRGDFRLKNFTCFGKKRKAFGTGAHHAIQRLAHGVGGTVSDKSSPARIGFHAPLFAQGLYGFANRRATHSKLFGEFALGRELVTGLQHTFEDGVFDLLDDLFVKTGRTNDFVHTHLAGCFEVVDS